MSADLTVEFFNGFAADSEIGRLVGAGFADGVTSGDFPAERVPPNGSEWCALLRLGNSIIGFATFFPYGMKDAMWLDLLWIAPSARRRGFGRFLVDAVFDKATGLGYRHLDLGTGWDHPARAMFGGTGRFTKTSVVYRRSE